MAAIETPYKGHKFKSRNEYKWAYFFDAINAPWYYEYQGYDLNKTWYLPDFYIPKWKCFFEAKDPGVYYDPSRGEEFEKAFWKCGNLRKETGHRVILCFGGFGSTLLDHMLIFVPKGSWKTIGSTVIAGWGAFGTCDGVDVLYLESDANPEMMEFLNNAPVSNRVKEFFIKDQGYLYDRKFIIPLHSSVGFNFAIIKENDGKIFAPYSDPLLCSFNAPFFRKFKIHAEAYKMARQAGYGDSSQEVINGNK